MDQTPPWRPSIWRFSLRELLLVMLAAAAFIGWATLLYRSGPLKPTKFFSQNETWQAEITSVFQELGEPPFSGAAGTTMHSEGTAANQRTFVFRLPLPHEKMGDFLSAFEKRIRDKLTAAGCKTAGEASGLGAHQAKAIRYQNGPLSGIVQICVGEAGNERVEVIMTMEEQQGSSTGFGLTLRGE